MIDQESVVRHVESNWELSLVEGVFEWGQNVSAPIILALLGYILPGRYTLNVRLRQRVRIALKYGMVWYGNFDIIDYKV